MALSTTETKYMAISKATRKAMWLWNLLNELGFTQNESTVIHIYNQVPRILFITTRQNTLTSNHTTKQVKS
jgi:hypothetical protein